MAAASAKPLAAPNFSPDSPPRLALTPDQLKHCSEALGFFKEKLQSPHQINQEFGFLQVFANAVGDEEKLHGSGWRDWLGFSKWAAQWVLAGFA
ncbi:hypothetical protein L484_025004 [Morus notabilis]|uniref:Uncharacterized protein n=1 Tax=Morus notabilis TaxID=981085 RepID=W9QKH2_9ROSA|nr:hypothetical protein L484_025004 [Morus notabilis]